jgi:hypothetical protein
MPQCNGVVEIGILGGRLQPGKQQVILDCG